MIRIDSAFEAGSIRVLSFADPEHIIVELSEDNAASVRQWFFFRLIRAKGRNVRVTFRDIDRDNANTGLAGMPTLWENYDAFASYDMHSWFPVATDFRDGDLVLSLTPQTDSVYLANFVPYTSERLKALIEDSLRSPRASLEVLGKSIEGRAIECLRVGEPATGRKVCWIITRQHPAETQGTWCVEGILKRLLNENDGVATALLEQAVFYIVPDMNPDGSRLGNTRTNAAGVNLNREWTSPSQDRSPEVYYTRRRMEETGMNFGLDIHAWTGPHNFAIGPYNTPTITARQKEIWSRYEAALAADSSEFEAGWPYPGGGPDEGQADISISWNYFSEAFGAVGVLYELLYKDNKCNPDPANGWTTDKCRKFGFSTVQAIATIVHLL